MWKPQPLTGLSACPGQLRNFFTYTTEIVSVNSDKFSIIIFQCMLTEREHSKYAFLNKTVRKNKSIFLMP
jgi:hypothetical protein